MHSPAFDSCACWNGMSHSRFTALRRQFSILISTMRLLLLGVLLFTNVHSQCTNETCLYGHCHGDRCVCDPGISGETCNKDILDCDATSCLNNGKCIELVNGFACQCSADFTGSRCQQRRAKQDDHCTRNCQNKSKCVVTNHAERCLCSPSYYGAYCEHKREPTSSPSMRKCSLVKLRNSRKATTCIAVELAPLLDVHCECHYSHKTKNIATCHITPSPNSEQKCSFKKQISVTLSSTLPDPVYVPVCPVNWEILDQFENTEERVNSVHITRCQLFSI